jgi:hypothetical protein
LTEASEVTQVENIGDTLEAERPLGENRTLALVVLILSTVIFGILFIPITICSFTSPITANFRQKRPIEVVEVYFLVCYFLSFPLVIIGSSITAWVKYNKRTYRIAILSSLIPVVYIVFYLWVEFLFDYALKSLPFL